MLKTEAEKKQKKITVEDVQYITGVFGNDDKYMEMIDRAFGVTMVLRGDELVISGDDIDYAENTVLDMMWVLKKGDELDEQRAEYIIALNREGKSYRNSRLSKDILCFTHRGKPVRAKTLGQINYANNIRENDVVFGVGPAGTGKTYLAVAMAVHALKNKEVQKIILARPAVEAGENLGFLPGDLQEKVDPYLRPLYDALFDILGRDAALRLKEKEIIEVVPLAYMRGRTLDNAFIILDEAQNSTREQMKMFLTRLGFGSKAVVTGDVTQIDLPRKKMSGLRDALRILKGVEGISFSFFEGDDVVRHPLVKRIIKAYESDDEERERREHREGHRGVKKDENNI